MMRFNTDLFLRENFKTPGGLIAFLRSYDASELPLQPAVDKWFQRRSVPSDWLPVLLAYIEIDRGQPVSVAKYLG
jgi:hypothetical protein